MPDAQPHAQAAPERTGGVCPYCGCPQHHPGVCEHCGAHTDPLSRQATQNEMGPWFVRDEANPFRPGCRFETIERWVRLGRIGPDTVLRGPSTNQHWTPAIRTPGVSRLLGRCHACGGEVETDAVICAACGVSLEIVRDRQYLGLCPVRALPGRADPRRVASSLLQSGSAAGTGRSTPPPASPQTPRPAAVAAPDASVRSVSSRLERRLRRAERTTRITGVLAGVFAVLFVIVLLQARGRTATPERTAEPSPQAAASRAVPPDGTPGETVAPPDAGVVEDGADQPAADQSASAVQAERAALIEARDRLIRRLDGLLGSGTPDGFEEAARILDTDAVLSDEQRATWRRRLEMARDARKRSAIP